jgi:hypothetical protein
MEEIALKESDRVINNPRLKVRLLDCTLDYIRNILNPGVLPGIYLEDAPYTWNYLSVFTTSPNKWRKERARTGKNGKPAMPKEVNEWEETSSGGTDDERDFAGETGGFWFGMGFTHNPTFVSSFLGSFCTLSQSSRPSFLSLV